MPKQKLVKAAQEIKSEANQLFGAASYDQAISCYDRALAACPIYLDYDVAVLRSNIAACYLKLEDWKAAVESATASIDRLDKIIPPASTDKSQSDGKEPNGQQNDPKDSDAVVEISGDDEEAEQKELQRLKENDETRTNVMRLRAKTLMRRAKAKTQLGGWGNLQGASEDYQTLAAMGNLSSDDRLVVQRALRELPGKINQAREKEMGEMMSKLKDVSDSALRFIVLVFPC